MSEEKKHFTETDDKDLLDHAIPIDELEEDEPEKKSEELEAIEIEAGQPSDEPAKQIRRFEKTDERQDNWKRVPNKTDSGATHVRTFVSKLRLDAIEHCDEQVNQWLDDHPEYEVKFVSSSIGVLVGKIKEEAIFMSVWV